MNNFVQASKGFIKRNAPTILTGIGSVGVVATAVIAVKATPKALAVIEKTEKEKGEKLTKMETVKVAGPAYIPTVITGVATIACIFGANVLNQRKQAALMSAYALLDSSYKEYKNKVMELYGEEADKEVKDEIAKDKYREQEYSMDDNDKQLYYDEYSGRYFEADTETILRAENEINKILSDHAGVYLNEVYEMLGMEITDYGDYMGWSSCEMYETTWSSWLHLDLRKTVLDDGLEVMIMSFSFDPTFDFENYY